LEKRSWHSLKISLRADISRQLVDGAAVSTRTRRRSWTCSRIEPEKSVLKASGNCRNITGKVYQCQASSNGKSRRSICALPSPRSLPTLSHVEPPALRMQEIASFTCSIGLVRPAQGHTRVWNSITLLWSPMRGLAFLALERIKVIQTPNRTERGRAFMSPM
jgi:hypothetical protein